MQQAEDFRGESIALFELLGAADPACFNEPTQFKDWSINTVLQHLHFWNQMAAFQLTDEAELAATLNHISAFEGGMRAYEAAHFQGLAGADLLSVWRDGVDKTADLFAACDPKARLKWAGPDMSARSSITCLLYTSPSPRDRG